MTSLKKYIEAAVGDQGAESGQNKPRAAHFDISFIKFMAHTLPDNCLLTHLADTEQHRHYIGRIFRQLSAQ